VDENHVWSGLNDDVTEAAENSNCYISKVLARRHYIKIVVRGDAEDLQHLI
jgi:hypothetical protein